MDDNVKAFWDERPCNIRHSDKPMGSKEYFEEVSAKKYFVEKHILEFAQFDAWNGKKVLEVGCGIGTAAQSFIEAGALYTGIDISPKSIELAKKRLGEGGDVKVADAQTDLVDEGVYDLVYSFGVLHHIPNLSKALENIRRALKPGGVFKLMMYAENSWKKMCIDAGLDQYEAQSGVPIAHTYTNDEITHILTNHGFTDVHIEQDHIFPWRIEEYKAHEYRKEPWFEAMPDDMFRAMEKRFGWHLLITCKSLEK